MNAGLSHPLGIESASGADGDTSTVRPTPRDAAHLAAAGDAVATVGGDGLPGVPSDEPWNEIDPDPDYSSEPYAFDPADIDALGWADRQFRAIRRIEGKQREIVRLAETEIARISDWRDRELGRLTPAVAWHRQCLIGFHRAALLLDRSRKTIGLPHGVLRARTYTTPVVKIADQEAVDAWAMESHPELWPEPKKLGVKNATKAVYIDETEGEYTVIDISTGEVVPGLVAEVPAATFDIDPYGNEPF